MTYAQHTVANIMETTVALKNIQIAEYLQIAADKLTRKINNENNRMIKDILKEELQQLQAHIVWLKGLPDDTKTK